MTCHACGRSLPDDARFCSGCGAAIVRACVACGTELESDARFCRRCGQPTSPVSAGPAVPSTEPREAARERKVATLLFADLVGFTALNEANDPELVSAAVSTAFARLAEEVRRYEGTVEKFAGDAMLAVFGVPAAHEDDPERAVRAALEMQAAMSSLAGRTSGPPLRLRIGIATGEVLADRSRASAERDLFVTGDAVNTASRLQSVAEPDSILVDAPTHTATRESIDYEELPSVALKGKEQPVALWRATSVRAGRGGRRGRLGLQAPLVGRDAELSLLKETVRRTADERRPHLVTVVGSAGVGKSRIAWELEKYLDGLPDRFHWRKGRCLAYQGPSFGPIAEVIKADARIADDDSPAVAREKLASRLADLAFDERDGADVRGALEAVLAVGDGRERPRDQLFEAWRLYLDAVASLAPLVLVVEDIHWADEGVLAFIEFLARWGEGPIALLCLARHELLERRSTWGGGLPNASIIVLEPLGAEASVALVDGLLTGGVPGDLADRLVALAEGNPLFVEELVRMLIDRGALRVAEGRWELVGAVDQLDIPDSVQAVLAARLDSLPPEEKRIAQDAAVVGRIFWDVIVAHLYGSERDPTRELIRRLRIKDLVVQRSPSSLADAAEFGFRHVLIRDVAYDSLPKRDRSRLHRDIALWAEAELADRVDEFSELIASHLAAALSYEEEFSEGAAELDAIRELTYAAAKRAAQRASSMSQFDASNRWIRLALDLGWKLGAPARELAQLTVRFGPIAWQTTDPEESVRVLARAIEAWEQARGDSDDDALLMAELRDQHATAIYGTDDVEGARRALREAIAELEPGPPSKARALLLNRLGWTYWRAGPVEEAVPLIERAIAEAEATDATTVLRWATHELGVTFAFLDRIDEGIALLERSHRMAREAGDRELLLRCCVNLPATREHRGDPIEPLLEMTLDGLELARRGVARQYITWLADNAADHLLELGRLAEAEALRDEAMMHAEAIAFIYLSSKHSARALSRLLWGDREGAMADVAAAERIGLPTEHQVAWTHPLSVAVLEWASEPRRAAEELARWAGEHIEGTTNAWMLTSTLARMALRLGDDALLARAVRLNEVAGAPPDSVLSRTRQRWLLALVEADHAAVEGAATALEDVGRRLDAANAWADAALLAARAGVESTAAARAAGLIEEMGLTPWLGPLPEERWLAAGTDAGRAPTI